MMCLAKKYIFFLFLSGMCLGYKADKEPKFKLIIFEGSDWCANCKRLEVKILSDIQFIESITGLDIEIEKIDFPQRKKLPKAIQQYNDSIAEKYAFDGNFPTLILSRTDTLIYQKMAYTNQSGEELLRQIKLKADLLK